MLRSFNKIWIPSTGKELFFAEITHDQEKILAKAAKQTTPNSSSFCFAIDKIMQENCLESYENFTIIDRLYYAIYTRGYCFDKELKYSVECGCGDTMSFNLEINEVLSKIKYTDRLLNIDFGNVLQYTIGWPRVLNDLEYRRLSDKNETSDHNLWRSSFIKEMSIEGNNVPSHFLTIENNLKLLSELDVSVTSNFYNTIDAFIEKETYKEIAYSYRCFNCGTLLYHLDTSLDSLFNFVLSIYNANLQDLYTKEMNFMTLFPGQPVGQLVPIERDHLISLKINSTQQQREASDYEDQFLDIM
jgi:hypothetical protein